MQNTLFSIIHNNMYILNITRWELQHLTTDTMKPDRHSPTEVNDTKLTNPVRLTLQHNIFGNCMPMANILPQGLAVKKKNSCIFQVSSASTSIRTMKNL